MTIVGPHQSIPLADDRERFAAELFDRLWDEYRSRVSYVQTYEQVVRSRQATFFNDHIAFRTIAAQEPLVGIASLSRIFEALGYRAAGTYHFADKHLSAIHFQHPNAQFPKLFISELQTWELGTTGKLGNTAQPLLELVAQHRPAISARVLRDLHAWQGITPARRDELMTQVLNQFQALPWPRPEKNTVVALNKSSQYAAWVAVHGYSVNHFTSLVNSHGVASLNDLDKTIAALRDAGVPMKAEIEGVVGSKLRQTATEAVMIDVNVLDAGKPTTMPWSYAYFELAERNPVFDPATGKSVRFEGFLGPQATNLFEMTRVAGK